MEHIRQFLDRNLSMLQSLFCIRKQLLGFKLKNVPLKKNGKATIHLYNLSKLSR